MPVMDTTTNFLAELLSARRESDRLFGILTPEGVYARPIAERHRVIFYIGHLDGFDAIQICREGLGIASPDPEFDALFQAGIDPDSAHLPSDSAADWPSLEEVQSYVARCRKRVDEVVERASEEVLMMALEHRLMHLETLAYMFHNFEYSAKQVSKAKLLERSSRKAPENHWLAIPAGEAILGKPHDEFFGWDNEFDETTRFVQEFRIQQNSVSNGDYLEFVKAGAEIPQFWRKRGDSIYYRGMFEEIPLPLDWPVYVTQAQAEAYARFIDKELLSEEQFHRAAYGTRNGEQRRYPWGNAEPSSRYGNFNFERWDPEPVDEKRLGESDFGVRQMVGNGWQWTNTKFGPLPGFVARPSYPGYSANFFDGEHYVMKGGSARTAARLLRRSFRNWFRSDYPYMYATFRCVEN